MQNSVREKVRVFRGGGWGVGGGGVG